jgi:superoxide dismutase, Fe-Mn family
MKIIMLPILLLALTGGSQLQLTHQELKTNYDMEKIMNTPAKELSFPELPYAYDALEPYIDQLTMEIHYSRHHKAYYDNLMKALVGSGLENKNLKEIFAEVSKAPVAIRNNGGGYYNHLLFWENMSKGGTRLEGKLLDEILKAWGSIEKFQEEFSTAAATRFGSGWAWLSLGADGKLFISSTPNQDNPLMDVADKKGTPLLALDVWEHAYYLKYQNKRADYIKSFWAVVNWQAVSTRYTIAISK